MHKTWAGAIVSIAVLLSQTALAVDVAAAEHLFRGNTLEQQGDHDGAIEEFRRVLTNDPSNEMALIGLCSALRGAGRLADAAKEYQVYVKKFPGSAYAHHAFSGVLKDLGRKPEALKEASLAAKLKPDDFMYHWDIAELFHEMKKFKEAVSEYKVAIRLNPDNPHLKRYLQQAQAGRPPQ